MAKKVSVAEIRRHGTQHDIWIVVNGEVYDMTEFAPEHPGGEESKPTTVTSVSQQVLTQQSFINTPVEMLPRRTTRYIPRP